MSFIFKKLEIPDIILIEPKVFGDARGFFFETYKKSEFVKNGIGIDFVQHSHSKSENGTLRGLHYQLNPDAQAKLVRVVSGEIFDVVVDIRKNSPSYGKWVSQTLSGENKKMLYIPEGFAHGFCVLSNSSEVIYSFTKEYNSNSDRGIIWNDSEIAIEWPISKPILSNKDLALPLLRDAENKFCI